MVVMAEIKQLGTLYHIFWGRDAVRSRNDANSMTSTEPIQTRDTGWNGLFGSTVHVLSYVIAFP